MEVTVRHKRARRAVSIQLSRCLRAAAQRTTARGWERSVRAFANVPRGCLQKGQATRSDLDTPRGKADTPPAFSVACPVTIFESFSLFSGCAGGVATLGDRFAT